MLVRFCQLRRKEVINLCDGCRLGYVGDVEICLPEGTVKAIVPGGRDFEVTVDFDAAGTKKMFAAFAKLKKV